MNAILEMPILIFSAETYREGTSLDVFGANGAAIFVLLLFVSWSPERSVLSRVVNVMAVTLAEGVGAGATAPTLPA